MKSNFEDVGDFFTKFDLPKYGDAAPRLLDQDLLNFRVRFMMEELEEFQTACEKEDLAKAVDALVDLCYVALGTAHMMHAPFDECWAAVQRANMKKVRAESAADARSTRKHRFDVVKPDGWEPPDLETIIQNSWPVKFPDRDTRMMGLAHYVARFSKDPRTKVGSVVVGDDNRKIAIAYNGFPPGIADDHRLLDRPTKYALIQHAERNALDNATFDLRGATLYTTVYPCAECAKSIVSKGVKRVVTHPAPEPLPDSDVDFRRSVTLASQIMAEASVEVCII